MARQGQSIDLLSHSQQSKSGRLRTLLSTVSAGLLLTMTGCQATTNCGLWRGWADVNSLGEPAAFVDQMRSDRFRTAASSTVQHDVSAIEFPRGNAHSGYQDCDVIPLVDPVLGVQQTSHAIPQSVGSVIAQPGVATQTFVKPAGAWLF